MKIRIAFLVSVAGMLLTYRAIAGDIWKLKASGANMSAARTAATVNAVRYLVYSADEQALRAQLRSANKGVGNELELPMPDGTMKLFRVQPNNLLPAELAAKYPELSTYTAICTDDPAITAKLDLTAYGFHAMIYNGDNTSFIDPAGDLHSGDHIVHYKRDELREEAHRMPCLVSGDEHELPLQNASMALQQRVSNGYQLRTYRLALSCNHQYAQAVTASPNPTKAQVLSKMVTTMNRVNGVYERELSITMVFIAKEDTLIFPAETGDPFGPANMSASTLLGLNQQICDSYIGGDNYDIGHIFSTGAGGLSQLGVICKAGMKAQSVTGSEEPKGDGFDIDYVAHEMGHEFGSQHTFNGGSASCYGNGVSSCAYEPGSGSTIMCYAGICSPDNLQPHSDAYFSASSLLQIQQYVTTGGDGCAVKAPTNNKMVSLTPFSASYKIPYQTPFELIAPAAVDSAGDTLVTYCWEQWDLGDFGQTITNTHVAGPIFRSYAPVKVPVRTFPKMSMVRRGILSNAGVDNATGEKAPDVARFLHFRLTMRNIRGAYGSFLFPDDSISLQAVNTGKGFTVTSQNEEGLTYSGNTTETVRWDVASTNTAPINADNVDIYMLADSTNTSSYFVGTFPNTGAASITIPNPDSTLYAARFKVKGTGNVFFNINSKDFKVLRNFESSVKIFPVPAHDVLHVEIENAASMQAAVFNEAGREQWRGDIIGNTDLPAYLWARGVYNIKFIDKQNHKIVKKFVVQ